MRKRNDKGFTLISLLAAIVVSSILMATIAPTWTFLVTRDKEEELIFRGTQYKEAIERYLKRYNKLPTKLDELVKTRSIRRLYLDPITGWEFELIVFTGAGNKRESELTKAQRESLHGDQPGGSSYGIMGVVSLSPEVALRPYNEKERYNEWEFVAEQQQEQQQQRRGDEPERDQGEEQR
jgi:type II secretory pathway pseudopilin PulG